MAGEAPRLGRRRAGAQRQRQRRRRRARGRRAARDAPARERRGAARRRWGPEEIGLIGSGRYAAKLGGRAAPDPRLRQPRHGRLAGEKAAVYAGSGERGQAIEAALREGLPPGAPEEDSAAPPTTRRLRASTSRSAGSSPGWTAATTGPATAWGTWTRRWPLRRLGRRLARLWRWRRDRPNVNGGWVGGGGGGCAGAQLVCPLDWRVDNSVRGPRVIPPPTQPQLTSARGARRPAGPSSPRSAEAREPSDGDHCVCGRSSTTPSSSMSTFSEKKQYMSRTGSASCSGRGSPDEVLDELAAHAHVPVGRGALVGAAGHVAARHEPLQVDVLGRQVPARRQRGLVEHPGAARVGEHLAVEQHAHVTRGAADVDPRVRVLGVAEELLGLGEPLVERVPAERDQALQEVRGRRGVRPGRARHDSVADRQRVPGQLAARARLALAGLRQQVGPHLARAGSGRRAAARSRAAASRGRCRRRSRRRRRRGSAATRPR